MAKVYGDEGGDREQWAKLKGAPLKDKISYFFTYYGLATLFIVIGVVFVVSFTVSYIRNSIPDVISGDFYTSPIREGSDEELKGVLCERMELNPKKYHISVVTTLMDSSDIQMAYTMTQKIIARITAGDLDFICSQTATFNGFMDDEELDGCAFLDLSEVLPAEDLKKLEETGHILYFNMKDGSSFPYLIDLNGTWLSEFFGLTESVENNVGITATAKNKEAFVQMIEWMLEKDGM